MPEIGSRRVVSPYWTSPCGNHEFFLGDSETTLSRMSSQSVHCAVTSPPYWGLRDYGTEGQLGTEKVLDCDGEGCDRCFVCHMVDVFRAVKRVLRNDGTVWLNLGDSYAKGSGLAGIPWRTAFALQRDGWILRQDIIWAKKNPMPESVRNRCTKSHEYVFLLSKCKDYFFDVEAIKEDSIESKSGNNKRKSAGQRGMSWENPLDPNDGVSGSVPWSGNKAQKRDVWTTSVGSCKGAHYAVFPPKLIEPMILAGTSEKGCCSVCKEPYERIIEKAKGKKADESGGDRDRSYNWSRNGIGGSLDGEPAKTITVGWQTSCECNGEVIPCTVLDPFAGSGTTAFVSKSLGRKSKGIELNEKYLKEDAIRRMG